MVDTSARAVQVLVSQLTTKLVTYVQQVSTVLVELPRKCLASLAPTTMFLSKLFARHALQERSAMLLD
jgi:hypothetical protein